MRLLTVVAEQRSLGPRNILPHRKGSLREGGQPDLLEGRRLSEAVYHPFTALTAGGKISESAPGAAKINLRELVPALDVPYDSVSPVQV